MIVVFGSLNLDVVMKVNRIPRPGETLLCPSFKKVPGGKGANQAVAAARAGAAVKLFGKVGDDESGRIVLDGIKQSSIDLTGVTIDKKLSTGYATICVDAQGENMIVVASGANLALEESEVPDFLLSKDSTLLMQMETSTEENWKLIKRAKKYGARIILNLAPVCKVPQEILKSVDVLMLNQIEANMLSLQLGFDVISPTVAARRIAANYGITCVVTLGKEGAIACSPQGTWLVQAMDVEPVDTTAAGDAFTGVFAASLDDNLDLPHALRRASVASGLTCLTVGAQLSLPTNQKIEERLKDVPLPRQAS